MNGFLGQLKPSLRSKVTKTSFVAVVEVNYVMRRLLIERTEHILEVSLHMQKSSNLKSQRRKFQDKLITILISKFSNVFTAPDGEVIKQD